MEPETVTWICKNCETEATFGADTIPEKCYKCGALTTEKSISGILENCGDFIAMIRRKFGNNKV